MELITQIINTIKQIQGVGHFRTEKSFTSEFRSILSQKLRDTGIFPETTSLEILNHKSNHEHYGFELMPGLVIHKPSELPNIENNFVFVAFNYGINPKRVRNNFYTLNQMFEKLNYKTGILINVGRFPDTYLYTYGSNYKDRVHELSIACESDINHIQHTYFTSQGIISEIV
jgi:hypothetical protein